MADKKITVHWVRDLVAEKEMTNLGMKWEYVKGHPTAKIDTEASLGNNARHTPINEAMVDTYRGKMAFGDWFPGIIVDHKGRILGGNHRFQAALRCDQITIDCYLVSATPSCAAEKFIVWDNARESAQPPTIEEKVEHAARLHLECGMKMLDSTRYVLGATDRYYEQVKRRVCEHKVRQDLKQEGYAVTKIEELATEKPGVLSALFPLSPSKEGGLKNTKLLRECTNCIRDNDLEIGQARSLVTAVLHQHTEKEQMKAIQTFSDEVKKDKEKEKVKVTPACTKLRSAVSHMYHILCGDVEYKSLKDFPVTDGEECLELMRMLRKIRTAINVLETSYKKEK